LGVDERIVEVDSGVDSETGHRFGLIATDAALYLYDATREDQQELVQFPFSEIKSVQVGEQPGFVGYFEFTTTAGRRFVLRGVTRSRCKLQKYVKAAARDARAPFDDTDP
jgi:hypothetical protein